MTSLKHSLHAVEDITCKDREDWRKHIDPIDPQMQLNHPKH